MNEICKNCKGLCLYSSECVSCVNCGLVSSTIVYGDDNVNIEERRDESLLQSESFLVGEIKIGLTSTRERVAVEILRVFKEQCDPWGVTVERVEVEFYL